MKKTISIGIRTGFLSIALMTCGFAWGQDNSSLKSTVFEQADTIAEYSIESLWVVDSPKENRVLRDQPVSSSIVQRKAMEDNRVFSMKSLTGLVPNLYIPDYGTKYTSSIYVRGIGSRINSPAVGIYVDGIPYFDKSGFDFDYSDIERVEVLRGPQGTLYGRNTMGGLINVRTKNPFDYSGTDLMLSAATKNGYRAYLTHYHRISDKFAFSAGGFYDYSGGFYRNEYTGKKIDKGSSAGGRMHGIWRPTDGLSFDLNVSYEYDDDGGYPYGAYDKATGEFSLPSYNYKSSYRRNLLNAGLITKYASSLGVEIVSATAWQYLKDRMTMDTDYSPADRFTMNQNQLQNTVSQEVIVKGKWNGFWGGMDFSTGVSGFYQWNRNFTPMTFGSDFISSLQATMDAAMAHSPVKVKLTDGYMDVPGLFHLPASGAAVFHQSVFNDLFGAEGLSATLAVRFDYEKVKIDYATSCAMNYQMTMRGKTTEGSYNVEYLGKQYQESMPVLPRVALKYDFDKRNNIYVMAAKGYRGGGFNIQMLSDYMQSDLQKNVGTLDNDSTINEALRYKPEYCWNHEIGGHFTSADNRLSMDASLFYMKVKDQQVSRFVESGLGRYTSNAGRSRSIGGEVSLIFQPIYGLNLAADYGYTEAKFTRNLTQVSVTKDGKRVLEDRDYKDRYVPFAPKHTLHLAASYAIDLGQDNKLTFGADYTGVGKVYFTEANDVSQKFYGLLGGRITYSTGKKKTSKSGYAGFEVSLWFSNILDKDYALFYFDSGNAGFMQRGRPSQAGIDLRLKF
ncbi:MAG: TonB-dependent receptor plug domain-containing protein [Bacteroidales bacterium]|nr:TonB-dependent receptor plug domain-containing protein [Bacteroidales bacterium]